MVGTGPSVVALVPAWNAAGFILDTLESLARQTHGNLRVIVSVDLSPDDTVAVCEAFAAKDPRFRVLRQTERQGWAGNTNALLREARGDYAFFAFHDDWLEPTYVSELVAALEADPGSAVAFSDLEITHLDGRVEVGVLEGIHAEGDLERRLEVLLAWDRPWWIPGRGLFRLDMARRIGGIQCFLAGEFSADFPWLIHLALHGAFLRVPQVLCHKRYMAGSLTRTWASSDSRCLAVTLSMVREGVRAELPPEARARALPHLVAFTLAHLLVMTERGLWDPPHYERQLVPLRQEPFPASFREACRAVGLEPDLVDFGALEPPPWTRLAKLLPTRSLRRRGRHPARHRALASQRLRLQEALGYLRSDAARTSARAYLEGLDFPASPWGAPLSLAWPPKA